MEPNSDQLLLPFAEKEYIDIGRTMRILGVCHSTVRKLYATGEIEIIDYEFRARKRVRYASVVALCDRLRTIYAIADRRPRLDASYLRHRDEDLLPFPLTDTIYAEDVERVLGYSDTTVLRVLAEGRFDAYKLASCWRVSRSSLARYMAQVRDREKLPMKSEISRTYSLLTGANL